MSLFRGWRKKLSSTIDCFSVNLSARPYNRHKPTPECVLEICDKTCKEQLYQPLAVHLCSYSLWVFKNWLLKFWFQEIEKNWNFFRNKFYEMRNTVVEKMTTLEFETELRNSWLLWEVSEGWWVGERISQCEIGHWWLQQILRLKLVTFLLWQFRQKFHLYLLMCSLFINVYLFSNW